MWLTAVRRKNKDRVFGLNFEAYVSSRTFTLPSLPPLTPPLPQPNPVMEDRIGRLEMMMTNMIAMMREMWVSSSSQPTASTSAPAPPPTDPLAQNEDDMDVADEEGLD
ncbi:UNVERIFIED_CONTAM: hypothetical protein Sindi_0016600 [Sesamum indicum]